MLKKAIFVSAILGFVASAQAQSSGFSVAGTVSPPSCTLTLGAGGVVDYGTQTVAVVKAKPVYNATVVHRLMGINQVPWSVTCTAAMPVRLAFTDNQAGKILAMTANDGFRYGLVNGASGTTSIGSYLIDFATATVDGAAANNFLKAPNGTTTWSATTQPSMSEPGKATGFIKTAGLTTPSSFTTASGTFDVTTYVSQPTLDALNSNVTLNGSTTINLQYL